MNFLITILISFVISLNCTPLVKKLSIRWNIVDHPGYRKIHRNPKALLGGLAIYVGFISTCLGYLIYHGLISNLIIVILIGSTIMMILGIIDDKIVLGATLKFALPSIASITVVMLGLRTIFLPTDLLNIIFSFIWIIGIVNAFNFIDNMDGITSGVAFISSMLFGILAYMTGQDVVAIISFCLAGACLGFLYFNFYPSKLFAGDAGSMFIGFILASIAILGSWKTESPTTSVLIPLFILGYAIFDVSLVTIFRIAHKKKPWIGDKNHSTHRLSAIGFSTRLTALIVYSIALITGLTSFIIIKVPLMVGGLILLLTISFLAILGVILGKVKIEQ